ncbi:CDGSH iron sulfur domain 2 [Columba livia]|uniref:CDGSH iron sulfur domain 2 n=1 Tax=Columba livia TaxID=8932 RepID=A0A2I0M909_COLLI|nr:CDGSH iron sulfur domain 2 [Columba livia]
MAAVIAFPGCAGLARLPRCSSIPPQEETAKG